MIVHVWQQTIYAKWDKYRLVLLQTTIAVGVVLVALLAGLIATAQRVDPLFALGVAIAPLVLSVWRRRSNQFQYGILGIVLTGGLFNFFTLPTGTESRIVVSLLIAIALTALWILRLVVIDKRIKLKPSPVNKPILIFAAVSLVSFGWSTLLRDPLVWVPHSWPIIQSAALIVNILLPVLILLVLNHVENINWLKRLAWLVVGVGTLVIVSELLHLPINRIYNNGSRGLFATWAGALAYALALYDTKLGWQIRLCLLAVVAGWVYRDFVLDSLWLSGWLPLFFACGVITFFHSRRLFVMAFALVLIFVAVNHTTLYQNIVVGNEEEGGLQRLELWQMNLQLVADHPLLGMGPAGYAVYNMAYHPLDARSTHNNYFDVLAQTGVVGFGVFLWLFGTLVYIGNQTRRAFARQRNFAEAFATATLAGCLAALVAMMLGDWVIPFAYNQTISGFDNASYTWILLGAMTSLYHIVQKDRCDGG